MTPASLSAEFRRFPSTWPVVPFLRAFSDETGGQTKIQKRDYLESGPLPVIDQGEAQVAGFTDDMEAQCRIPTPCILFGDHTRVFKWVQRPFALGADGVKVLRQSEDLDPRFAFHYLHQLRLPSAGYSRHFKFLKRAYVPLPPLPEQRRIADILDKADAIRRKRQEALKQADGFLRSVFSEMFGDPVKNPSGWETSTIDNLCAVQGGLQVTSKRNKHVLSLPYLRVANVYRDRLDLDEIKMIGITEAEAERVRLVAGDVLVVEGHGNKDEIGRSAVWDGSIENCVHQNHLIRVRPYENRLDPVYLSAYLNSAGGRRQMLRAGKTTSGLNTISTSNVRATKVLVPPIERQRAYAVCVDATASLRRRLNGSATELGTLFNSLVQRAFRGEL